MWNRGLTTVAVVAMAICLCVSVAAADEPGQPLRVSFDAEAALSTWTVDGDVAITDVAYEGAGAVRLARTLEQIETRTRLVGPTFDAKPGNWQVEGAAKSALYSPDNSYQAVLQVEFLNAAGKTLETPTAWLQTGEANWRPFRRTVKAPAGTTQARYRMELRKTYGEFLVDGLSISWQPPSADEANPVARIMAKPEDVTGIFYPDATPTYTITVLAREPLGDTPVAIATLADAYGAEVAPSETVELKADGETKDGELRYTGMLALADDALALGKYYDLHIDVPAEGYKAKRHTIGTARLPEAVTRQYEPAEIPFTIRNWDSRIAIYFRQADRIGIRQVGVWGGWKKEAPYEAHLPGLKLIEELGLGYVTGTPGSQIERGATDWSDEALREGMTNFLKAYADKGITGVALGNEPHGSGDVVTRNVAAYKVMYEAIKAYDPSITVIATSVGPEEEYFAKGYHNYCDMYDFHIYQSYESIRRQIAGYKELMEKYDAVKPIVSTELGLNSQGMSRRAVSVEMVKKFSVFFAAGGEHVSWFTMQYPDGSGKAAGSFGQAHCVFDSRYNISTPKMDAITYYHMVNGISIKDHVQEELWEGGVVGELFRDVNGQCLVVLWSDQGRQDIHLPLPGITELQVVALDGETTPLTVAEGLTLTVDTDPVLLLLDSQDLALPKTLETAPALKLASDITPILKGGATSLSFHGLAPGALSVELPRGWSHEAQPAPAAAGSHPIAITAPAVTNATAGSVRVALRDGEVTRALLSVVVPVESPYSVALRPMPTTLNTPGGVAVLLGNKGQEPTTLRWELSLEYEIPMDLGRYVLATRDVPAAYFSEASEGSVTLKPGSRVDLQIPLADFDPQTLYMARLLVTAEDGRQTEVRRYVSGLQQAARASKVVIDGNLDDADWQTVPPAIVSEARQFYPMGKKRRTEDRWLGPDDLSASIRYLWDEQYLYVGAIVTDEAHVAPWADGRLWNMDGLQFLVDVNRDQKEKSGQYDYSLGLGTKGAQMFCHTSGAASVPAGHVTDAQLKIVRDDAAGTTTYELALPWSRLVDFAPAPNANLGLTVILNDDDGEGRDFMGWFSGAHSKQLDMVGDIILTD